MKLCKATYELSYKNLTEIKITYEIMQSYTTTQLKDLNWDYLTNGSKDYRNRLLYHAMEIRLSHIMG